jgi:hypothetical protein
MQPDPDTHFRLLEQDLERRLAARQLQRAARPSGPPWWKLIASRTLFALAGAATAAGGRLATHGDATARFRSAQPATDDHSSRMGVADCG